MKVVARLKQFIENQGVSYNSLDVKLGAGKGYIGKQIKNQGSIGSDVLEKLLSQYPELNPKWLLTGKGQMLTQNERTQEECQACVEKERKIIELEAQVRLLKELLQEGKNSASTTRRSA